MNTSLIVHCGIFLLLVSVAPGCFQRRDLIRAVKGVCFVVEENFSGPFIMIESPNGTKLDWNSQEVQIIIPSNGVVRLKSAAGLKEMRQWSARTFSGKRIGVYEITAGEVGLRGGSYVCNNDRKPRFEFFIGTLKDFNSFDFAKWCTDKGF